MQARDRREIPRACIAVTAALVVLGAPALGTAEGIRGVHYFGHAAPTTFWDSDISDAKHDFQQIKNDGFNSVFLDIPWVEIQPGLHPPRFNEEALSRVSRVCEAAKSIHLSVFMRVSYLWDFSPGGELERGARMLAVLHDDALLQTWELYLERVRQATKGCATASFLSWEDFFGLVASASQLRRPGARDDLARTSGFSEWASTHADAACRPPAGGPADFIPIPEPASPCFRLVYEFFDHLLVDRMFPALARHFPEATLEARVDSDPIYRGKELVEWCPHRRLFSVSPARFLMVYWAPAIGALNQGERQPAETVLRRFSSLLRDWAARSRGQVIINQLLIDDNTPKFSTNARIEANDLDKFLRLAAAPILEVLCRIAIHLKFHFGMA